MTGQPVKERESYHMLWTSAQYPTFLNVNGTCQSVCFTMPLGGVWKRSDPTTTDKRNANKVGNATKSAKK